jgi:hypothetical protein
MRRRDKRNGDGDYGEGDERADQSALRVDQSVRKTCKLPANIARRRSLGCQKSWLPGLFLF